MYHLHSGNTLASDYCSLTLKGLLYQLLYTYMYIKYTYNASPKETERLSRVAKMALTRGAKRTSTNRY